MIMQRLDHLILALCAIATTAAAKNLVPDQPVPTPNYWCTWAAQNYIYGQGAATMDIAEAVANSGLHAAKLMHESRIFGDRGWINFYPKIRGDVFFLIDNGYQVNVIANDKFQPNSGISTELDPAKFPSFPGAPQERLKQLNERIKAAGWRGLGLWLGSGADEAYARERLLWSRYAGVGYWKVDCGDEGFTLNRIGREVYPELIFEHALCSPNFNEGPHGRAPSDYGTGHRLSCLKHSNVMRIYDCDHPLRFTSALDRVALALKAASTTPDAKGIVNCEDEVYLAAVLGCSMGVFRFPQVGLRPGGDLDVFMAGPRQLKKRIDEVTRAVLWHRIAPPFSASAAAVSVDDSVFADSWDFRLGDTWDASKIGVISQSAPARVSRGVALPEVKCDGEPPYVMASRHPNGAVAVGTQGRTRPGIGWFIEPADVTLKLDEVPPAIGVFGRFRSLTFTFNQPLPAGTQIWAQDLAGDKATDISARVKIDGQHLLLPGNLIAEVGLSAATPGDVSDPGCVIAIICPPAGAAPTPQKATKENEHPKIVNIVNFIRLLEPRDANKTQDLLYQAVVKQVEIMNQYKLGGSFLLQYDALMDCRYQKLLKSLPLDSFEIGGWWEIPQPLVEKAGLKWRGRYPWDCDANVGFSTGYSPAEREKLVDVFMADFKAIFGYYPKSVGSWFIDAHTLNYLYEKYHIVASCNCKDQYGTDGYTLWGGYWNQAYYPSKINSYMPAQNERNQTAVPIFRMLGSDPIRQYDDALGTGKQLVVTMEPVYQFGGGDSDWVNWFFKGFVEGASMDFAYLQTGQENSFTWDAMAKGFEIQMPLIARLRDEKKVRVETLAASGQWFKDHYKVTPPTSVTITEDLKGGDRKTVWFNSRFFRVNVLWENGSLRLRDIHVFNENVPSEYTTKSAASNECSFLTLPFVDGYVWSDPGKIAGLRLKGVIDGKEVLIEGGDPVVNDAVPGKLQISWPLKTIKGTLVINLDERKMQMKLEGAQSITWFLDFTAADQAKLPFKNIAPARIDCQFQDFNYSVSALAGSFSTPGNGVVFRLSPAQNSLLLDFSDADSK
jgi:hypothetical protein